jgi:hypothetical protein
MGLSKEDWEEFEDVDGRIILSVAVSCCSPSADGRTDVVLLLWTHVCGDHGSGHCAALTRQEGKVQRNDGFWGIQINYSRGTEWRTRWPGKKK